MANQHPIEALVATALEKIREVVDVETIIGEPISATEGVTIIPVSKVSFGFASGGSDIPSEKVNRPVFGGGSGAGVSISPIAFLVISKDGEVKLLQLASNSGANGFLEQLPDLISKVKAMFSKEKKSADECDDKNEK